MKAMTTQEIDVLIQRGTAAAATIRDMAEVTEMPHPEHAMYTQEMMMGAVEYLRRRRTVAERLAQDLRSAPNIAMAPSTALQVAQQLIELGWREPEEQP